MNLLHFFGLFLGWCTSLWSRRGLSGILVHQLGQQDLVERAPVDADAHRLVVGQRHVHDGATSDTLVPVGFPELATYTCDGLWFAPPEERYPDF